MDPRTQDEKIRSELKWCFTYDQAEVCSGASGRKLRQTCVWCPRFKDNLSRKKEKEDEKNH